MPKSLGVRTAGQKKRKNKKPLTLVYRTVVSGLVAPKCEMAAFCSRWKIVRSSTGIDWMERAMLFQRVSV